MTAAAPVDPSRYAYRVTWVPEDEEFVATCLEIPGQSYAAELPETALAGLRKQLIDYVADCEGNGEAVPEPLSTRSYSGTITVTVGKELHRRLALEAAGQGIGLDLHATRKLAATL